MHRTGQPAPDWDPVSADALNNQRATYDAMRETCPVAYSDQWGWSLFRHEDVLRVLLDHDTFSNVVSRHRSVPNGMDPPEHTVYRRVIVPYFAEEPMRRFEPVCRTVAADLVQATLAGERLELMREFALVAAVRIHCAFLGWPAGARDFLVDWIGRSNQATLAQDRPALAAIAREFEAFIGDMLAQRRADDSPRDDVTASLMREEVQGRPLNDAEITSILRNWTAGEIGTISAAIGIVVHYLAHHQELQDRLRAEPDLLAPAIDEILRLHGPLVANRRVTTRAVEIGGRTIGANERISLNWISANRDGRVFTDPGAFSLERDPADNLLYGAGIHVCPGAPLARMELRITLEELLARTSRIELDTEQPLALAVYPASGYTTLAVRLV